MYLKEKLIIGCMWLFCLVSLWFIPKSKRREASFLFLAAQLYSWIFGLIVVEMGLLEYPVRILYKANATSFSFEYLALPFICILFNIYYPIKKSVLNKLIYYITILIPFTIFEWLTERYTKVLHYITWEWYYTFISMWLFFYLIRAIYKWFFRLERPLSL